MMKLEYIQKGDFLFPNLAMDEPKSDIGKYGRMRCKFLKEQCEELYCGLLLSGELLTHLVDINDRAKEQVERIVSEMAARNGVTESLKAADQMEWVRRMNSFHAAAEEIVMSELVYC